MNFLKLKILALATECDVAAVGLSWLATTHAATTCKGA
jgi:hypothetical protein